MDGTIKLTAYADAVNLYVTQSSDINIINSILSTYQSVSNAKVNWTKSCGLKMNGWDVGLNCKLGISWNTKEQSFFRPFKRYSLILYGKVVKSDILYLFKSHGGWGVMHHFHIIVTIFNPGLQK